MKTKKSSHVSKIIMMFQEPDQGSEIRWSLAKRKECETIKCLKLILLLFAWKLN